MGTLYEKIQALCKARGISGSKMCLELGLSKSTLSDMKSGRIKNISVPTAQKIAGYFGISVDELYETETKKETPAANNSHGLDEEFMNDYARLSEEQKNVIRDYARFLLSNRE